MKRLLFLTAVLFANFTFAQETTCNCSQALNQLINKIENNYPGFEDKTKDKESYNDFETNLINQSKSSDDLACQKTMKKYTDFFKDPHLWVGMNNRPFANANNSSAEKLNIDIKDFQKKIVKSNDDLEGVWSTDGYKIGIKKTNANEYVGFIIESASNSWKAGDVKFKIFSDQKFEYLLGDKSKKYGKYKFFDKNILFFDEIDVVLAKEISKPSVAFEQQEKRLKDLIGFSFKKVSEQTSILKLPSFEHHLVKEIDKLIDDNKALLENSENLIIDIRGNGGGTTDAYQKLLPYISGKSIQHTGVEFLASQTFLNSLEKYKKNLGKDESTEVVDNQIAKVKENLGRYFNYDEKGGLNRIQKIDIAPKSPKNIVILANKWTGSSAEYLLYIAKQSKKVKIMGIPSYGALDYGNAIYTDFGCQDYQLLLPTYKAMRLPEYPIDNIGIQPDIYLDQSVEDWTQFATDYLEN
ncbi:S41 family peptidase [Chryseobacterium sp. FH1]|uniref:S41 family peptidase n=1 Tax=Chryseobacterium sp. FH1 TaxID=1233951 RepID=UPI00068BC7C6|nr:S41 family peptidase [Chryseobacterium sp. FH1]